MLARLYDDGGISGGTLERPGLQSLLSDIRERKIDVVVVYKVDRLTRSLGDFAKLVELFDAHSVSFVSVTQQFNTTTSMGRLTLNVLLSFAQFEREITAERIRDKIAASKQKGIWVGGSVPLGYATKDKKLVIVEEAAEQVRTIFRRYLELGSLFELRENLQRQGIVSTRRILSSGRVVGGTPYYVGGLAYLLKNRMYIGEINHKGKSYPGQHQPILDRGLFDAVQSQFAANAVELKRMRTSSDALLMGKLFDDAGNRMSPTSTQKRSARYRYYISATLLGGTRGGAGPTRRVPAPDIEATVVNAVRNSWQDGSEHLRQPLPDNVILIADLLERAVVSNDSVRIALKIRCEGESQQKILTVPFSISNTRPKRETIPAEEVVDENLLQMRSNKRKRLIVRIAKARVWADDLSSGRAKDLSDIARRERTSERHIRMGLPLAFLAPFVAGAAIAGVLPARLGVSRIPRALALSWNEQRRLLAP